MRPPELRVQLAALAAVRRYGCGAGGGTGLVGDLAPLQPTEAERSLSPQIVAADRDVLVVRWHQRGRSAAGDTIDTPVLACDTIEDGRLKHAEMFYFDL